MIEIKTQDSVGHIICHDITRIIPGGVKEAAFKKGHVVREEDIPELQKLGKFNLYVWENNDDMMHENEAATFIYDLVAGENMHPTEVNEGKINIIADKRGLLTIDNERLLRLNSIGQISLATRHDYSPVQPGDLLAGTRIVPLIIEKEKMDSAKEAIGDKSIFTLTPYSRKKVAIIVTGSEVYKGLIEDGFSPVVIEKVETEYNAEVISVVNVPDDDESATAEIMKAIDMGADMVMLTGGMSVDPDDKTPLAIKNTGADIVTYGTPVLPGTMFMLAYYDGKPIMGLPGCVMHSKRTVLDLVLPRLMADMKVSKDDIDAMGKGGQCLSCPVCNFPICGFGAV